MRHSSATPRRRANRHSVTAAALFALGLASPVLLSCDHVAFFEGEEQLRIDTSVEPSEHPLFPYYVQSEYLLSYGAPTAGELAELQPGDAEPAAQDPWVEADKIDISVQWRLENTSDQEIVAWVMLDGATEFFDWNPVAFYGVAGGEDADEIAFPTLVGFYPRTLAPGEVVRGEFREDDLEEASYDLDVMTRFCGGPLALLHNRHEVDPVGTEMVPADATLAGLVMIRLTLAASGAATLDYSLRVRDGDELLFDGNEDDQRYAPEPEIYVPAGFAQVAPGEEDPGVTSDYCGEETDDET